MPKTLYLLKRLEMPFKGLKKPTAGEEMISHPWGIAYPAKPQKNDFFNFGACPKPKMLVRYPDSLGPPSEKLAQKALKF